MHRLVTDEVFHFYAGDPCEMIRLYPDGSGETVLFGNDLTLGQRPQVRVPRNVWQGMRLLPGGTFALMGCHRGSRIRVRGLRPRRQDGTPGPISRFRGTDHPADRRIKDGARPEERTPDTGTAGKEATL